MTKCEHNYLPYNWEISGWKNNGSIARYDGKVVSSVYCTKCLKVTSEFKKQRMI